MWSALHATALAVLFAGCTVRTGAGPPPDVTVDDSANGTRVQLQPGQRLVIRLASNRTTGFSWSLVRGSGAMLHLSSNTYEPATPRGQTPVMGAVGTDVFVFTATGTGTAQIELVYRRGSAGPPARSISLTVAIGAPS